MNATSSVAASSAPAPSSGPGNAPADASAVGDFAAMLEALSLLPAAAPALDAAAVEGEAVAGEEADANQAGSEGGIAVLANGWPWLGLQTAAPALPATGSSATPSNAASPTTGVSPTDAAAAPTSHLGITPAGHPALQAAGAPDVPPRAKVAQAAADTPLQAAFTPTPEASRAEAPAPLTDAASALSPTAAAIAPALSPSTHAAPVHQAALPSRPGEASFAADLAAEVRVMVEGGLQEAELSLHPAELGPIQVQLRVHGASADISLVAANGFTRDGLAQALPELREMLASQGLQLGQAGVDAGRDGRGFADAQQPQERGDQPAAAGSARDTSVASPAPRRVVPARTLLDLYA